MPYSLEMKEYIAKAIDARFMDLMDGSPMAAKL